MRISSSRTNKNRFDRLGSLLPLDITRQTFFHSSVHRVEIEMIAIGADGDERFDLRKGGGTANVDGFDSRLRIREIRGDFFRYRSG